MIKTVSLDLHDFSVLNNRLDLLTQIKEHYPGFKVSMFAIPVHTPYEVVPSNRVMRSAALEKVKQNLDWIQIIPHGLSHIPREMENCDYYTFRDLVFPAIAEAFDKDDLPYEKGFCAPYWLWNKDVVRALDEAGWFGAIDRNQPNMLKTKKIYTYTHSLEEPFWKSDKETLLLHGHIDGTSANDLERCLTNILKLPADVEWKYVTDFITEADDREGFPELWEHLKKNNKEE